jgi:hypothetical protein
MSEHPEQRSPAHPHDDLPPLNDQHQVYNPEESRPQGEQPSNEANGHYASEAPKDARPMYRSRTPSQENRN